MISWRAGRATGDLRLAVEREAVVARGSCCEKGGKQQHQLAAVAEQTTEKRPPSLINVPQFGRPSLAGG